MNHIWNLIIFLKSLKIAQAQDVPLQSQRSSLSRANHTMLTEIFQKIGNKDNTKEGLNLLYDFMRQHPEADIEPFLKNSSEFFQGYIRNGLKEIENLRKMEKHMNSGKFTRLKYCVIINCSTGQPGQWLILGHFHNLVISKRINRL